MKALKPVVAMFLLGLACGPALQQPCGPGPHDVEATVSSITLGDACAASATAPGLIGDCAAESPSCGICRASSVQLDIVSKQHQNASFTVREVRLYDPNTHQLVDTLYPSAPTKWDGSQYSAWDELVPALSNLKAKYTLTAPDYSKAGANTRFAFPQAYDTQVDVEIDGQLQTLTGPTAHREPEVAT